MWSSLFWDSFSILKNLQQYIFLNTSWKPETNLSHSKSFIWFLTSSGIRKVQGKQFLSIVSTILMRVDCYAYFRLYSSGSNIIGYNWSLIRNWKMRNITLENLVFPVWFKTKLRKNNVNISNENVIKMKWNFQEKFLFDRCNKLKKR